MHESIILMIYIFPLSFLVSELVDFVFAEDIGIEVTANSMFVVVGDAL